MNGIISVKEESVIDRKPIITCGGELEVFSGIEDALTAALPQDSCEWRRSLGRPVKSVHIGVKFTPFSPAGLPRENQWDLIRHPLFHIYWTECTDVETYKVSVRDDIDSWLKELTLRNITDWLIVVVETYDAKRTNKLLPRTTVLDKIRADFAPKQGDRCISVLSPNRHETRTADSWRGLVARVRHLVLVAYARAVTKLEDYVRQQRERRNELGWHFLKYFQLQEELAQVLEMLGLYDESLVQYDELDALFSQFVVNGHMGDAASWLSEFQVPLERWHGLRLGPAVLPTQPSLLELRSYLFAKQAHMLLLTNKPWEMASRCLPFLHTCVRELNLLEVSAPAGSVACWLFLACLEVLHTCDKFNDSGQVEAYSLYTAGLWAYASQKLRELGELCGLMPGTDPTSEQLHIVVGLSAGMGDCPGTPSNPSPTDKLKEALCSKDVFNRHYLELSELAMGTYKHIGRLRSARLVGRELASFYKLLGETNKAAAFLGDALKTFEQEGWRDLAVQTHVELAACYTQANDTRRYLRSCATIAAAPEMDTIVRCSYFDDMLRSLDSIDKQLVVPFVNIIKIQNITIKPNNYCYGSDGCSGDNFDDKKIKQQQQQQQQQQFIGGAVLVMQDTHLEIQLELESGFPRELLCNNVMISLEPEKCSSASSSNSNNNNNNSSSNSSNTTDINNSNNNNSSSSNNSNSSSSYGLRNLTAKDLRPPDPMLQRMRIQKHLDFRQDKQIASASVVCRNAPLKRADSTAVKLIRSDFLHSATAANLPLVLTPGLNTINLRWLAQPGRYSLSQIAIHVRNLEFLSAILTPKLKVLVRREEPSVRLDTGTVGDLLSGLEQLMLLTITIGSYPIENSASVKLRCSDGLTMHYDPTAKLQSELFIPLENYVPFSCTRLKLRVRSESPKKEHTVAVHCPWTSNKLTVPLSFTAPLSVTHKLHTSKHRKYVQLIIAGQTTRQVQLNAVHLNTLKTPSSINYDFVQLKDFNPPLIHNGHCSILSQGVNISYMWELITDSKHKNYRKPIKMEFNVEYMALWGEDETPLDINRRTYTYNFELQDYETIYIVEARVEPTKGSEFCRVGALCHLRLNICYVCTEDDEFDGSSNSLLSKNTAANEPKTDSTIDNDGDDDNDDVNDLIKNVCTVTRSLMYEVLAEQSVWAVCGRTAGVVSLEHTVGPQSVTLDVMPLASGYLPLPLIRLSKYIPADKTITDSVRKPDAANTHPRLEPFSPGQVYNMSKAQQVHVLAPINEHGGS